MLTIVNIRIYAADQHYYSNMRPYTDIKWVLFCIFCMNVSVF